MVGPPVVGTHTLAPPAAGEVLVLLAELQTWSGRVHELRRTLSSDEEQRAARFATTPLREAFEIAHGLLRQVLGACLGCAPEALVLGAHSRGKPHLVTPSATLGFNLSHTRAHVAVALASAEARPGVDIEEGARVVSPALLEACTSPNERALCAEVRDEAARRALFFRIWTRKEALLKAAGLGLAVELASLDVTPERPTATLPLPGDGEGPSAEPRPFTAVSLTGLPGELACAVACAGTAAPVVRLVTLRP